MTNKHDITFRTVNMDDAELLLAWRNDSLTRKMSRTTDEVAPESHLDWLARSLEDNSRKIYIAEHNDEKVGVVRSDFSNGIYEISWTIAPDYRGKGMGKAMVEQFIQDIPGSVCAYIKPNNEASIQIALNAKMTCVRENDSMLYFEKRR